MARAGLFFLAALVLTLAPVPPGEAQAVCPDGKVKPSLRDCAPVSDAGKKQGVGGDSGTLSGGDGGKSKDGPSMVFEKMPSPVYKPKPPPKPKPKEDCMSCAD